MRPNPLALLVSQQMGILMNQGDQEPKPIGVVVDGDPYPSVFIPPEISVLGGPPPGNFQMTGILLQRIRASSRAASGTYFDKMSLLFSTD